MLELVPFDRSGPAAAAAIQVAFAMYEKLLPIKPPAEMSVDHLAQTLTTHAQQVGRLAWEILYGIGAPKKP